MTSNVYIARGERDGVVVMKVGKSDNVHRRQREIGISVEMSISQTDRGSAFDIETQLRDFVIAQGGKRFLGTYDWFYFDPHIYAALCAVVANINQEATADAEISLLRTRYHQLLEDETEYKVALAQRDAALAQVAQLEKELERLKEANAAKQKRIEELIMEAAGIEYLREANAAKDKYIEKLLREIGELKYQIGWFKGKLEFYEEKDAGG